MSVGVSVIVAVHDGGAHLRTALDSVLASSWRDLELIVVDDGSTDDSLAVARSYDDPRVLPIVLERNVGVAAAREVGVAHSAGEYVWFVDADDAVPSTGLEAMITAARQSGADVVVGESVVVGGASRTSPPASAHWTGPEALRSLLLGRIRGQLWDKLIAGDLLRSLEIPHSRVHSDVALVARCLAASGVVVRVDDLVYSYTVRADSIIGRSRRRAESLRSVEQVVTAAAAATAPVPYDAIAYYRARFIGLSMIRDSAGGGWSQDESAGLQQEGRDRIAWAAIRLALTGSEWRVAATLAVARLRPGLFLTGRRWARVSR
ncbi:glycosyltransferase family A protein [Rhodococcus sp. SORGH_AS_0301]|uniref:glycosyltransferase family 2 protein n=1 Tax=Rhodococcus sp. SORGH_AS_0301 TaxID=3041780 RepID=UPI0027862A85|nr:glycosyltransferase family A protein [Rhodococcus sp. SORGH_AS_0301]MDQ1181543.1 glycosyltransferase involved in cell wall biosynthesis [Rhodococcus sp. SORGH_AS_0301]